MSCSMVNEDGKAEEASVKVMRSDDASLTASASFSTSDFREIFGIPVTVERDGDQFLVTDHEINMYGVGDTVEGAVEDYRSVVLEYFEILEERAERLSEHLMRHLRYLRTKAQHFGQEQ